MTTVIVPAHNEAAVIERTIASVLEAGDDLDVIVVCNGCSDDTARVARRFGDRIRVVATDVAGKANALNLGDAVAHGFPRVYLDADVVIARETLDALVEALAEPGVGAAAPALELDESRCSWLVRAYLAIWQRLPQVRGALSSRGVYALSESGHRRLGSFPDVVNDDGYVNALFGDGTARYLTTVSSRITPPRTLGALIARRIRVVVGNRQLNALLPRRAHSSRLPGWLQVVIARPRLLPALLVFLPTSAYVAWSARRYERRGGPVPWGQDAASRPAAGERA